MILGFIGTGNIVSDVVTGICKSQISVKKIIVSPRNKKKSNQLKKNHGATSLEFRKRMSQSAFTETAYYDSLIANYFNEFTRNTFPQKKIIHSKLIEQLRYGENPHQKSSIYSFGNSLELKKLNGKQLSYNNFNDIFKR